MRALLVHVRPHRRTLVVAALLGLLGAAAGLAQPLAAREVPSTSGCSSGPPSGSCCARATC